MPDLPLPFSKWEWWKRPITPHESLRKQRSERQMAASDFLYCLYHWAAVYKTHDPALKAEREEFLAHWEYIRRKIDSSNLLFRFFRGDALRRIICPKHNLGHSHCDVPDCDCQGIGWLPQPSDQLTLFDLGRKRKWGLS